MIISNKATNHGSTLNGVGGNVNGNTIKQPPLNDDRLYGGKINRNLWSMDAPNIIRIQPKLILLPDVCKEFYMLCNDGNVRSYRIREYKLIQKPVTIMKLIRDQQLVKFCNELFKSDSQTRKRFLCNNQITNSVILYKNLHRLII